MYTHYTDTQLYFENNTSIQIQIYRYTYIFTSFVDSQKKK